ncbi:MAG: molybdopterin-dependent oxidoreductase [Acidimicrobiia bacterium]|nr:molybdopterin-dependent oxidoreductase [Acidimicrobiia bacterium]
MRRVSLSLHGLTTQDGERRGSESYDLVEMRARPIEWDSVTRVSHAVNCGMNIGCSLAAYTWKGVVLREEQSANYEPPTDPDIPDRNPRGCQMGVCYSHRMYDPQRVKFPVKRVGQRGEGRWERITWDQALTEIADRLIDVLVEHGPKTVVNAGGTHGEAGGGFGKSAWAALMGGAGVLASMPNSDIGDDHEGALVTFGHSDFVSSAEDWYLADMILVWGTNPAYTQLTWCHYLSEARYNGTKVVSISPDYNASAIHVDEWVPVRPGTDAALGLAMSQVIVSESRYDEAFVREQTDLPLLVRSDTGKFLRQRDLQEGGRDHVFYVVDRRSGAIVEAPHRTLSLDGLDPELEGAWTATTVDGDVEVRTVFGLLAEMLDRDYTPEQASEICGVPADTIRRLAREFAAADGVVNLIHYNTGRHYHGNLIERAMIYNWVLCGHIGRPGANYNAFGALITPESAEGSLLDAIAETAIFHPRYEEWQERNFSDYRIRRELFAELVSQFIQETSLFYYFHTGLLELSAREGSWDPYLKRTVQEYVDEALASGTRPVQPAPGTDPKALFVWGGDPMRRARANQLLVENLFPKLDLVVTTDWRWSGTAAYSDYVLPACGLYEHTKGFVAFTLFTQPIGHFSFKAADPLYESRSDFWIGVMLLKKLAARAREREIGAFSDPVTGGEHRLDHIDDLITDNGRYSEDDEEAVARDLYESTVNVVQGPWEELRNRGWVAFTSPGREPFSADHPGGLRPGEPALPLTRHVQGKEPYTTSTGRIQTYVDHDWYLELGEALACHKDPPRAGGDHPIVLSGGHARWSIHTLWAENPLMLRLQRGEPVIVLGDQDASERGIADGDLVEVFNDVGRFTIQAAVTPRVPRGFAAVYHQWTNAQFRDGNHFKQVMPSPFNPIEFAPVTFAEHPNLTWDLFSGSPGSNDRDTRVEIRLAAPSAPS